MAHAGGRPTEYKEIYIKKVDEYLAIEKDKGKSVKLPTIEGFSTFINTPRRTVSDWQNDFPEFSLALEKITKEQQKRLINKGLSGDYNSTIAKLVLSANHGMREKSDLTTDGKEIKGNTIEFKSFKDND